MAYGHYLGVHIAHPNQTVALDSVPQILLHIEMYGAGSRLPNLIQTLVVALECAAIFQVAHNRYGTHLFEMQLAVVVQKVDANKAEPRVTQLYLSQPRQSGLKVAYGVVVCGAILAVNLAHSLTCRLAITYTNTHGRVVCGHTRHNLQAAVQLTTEVEQNGGVFGRGALHHADVAVCEVGLTVAFAQEILYIGDVVAVLGPYDARGGDILALELARVFIYLYGLLLWENAFYCGQKHAAHDDDDKG